MKKYLSGLAGSLLSGNTLTKSSEKALQQLNKLGIEYNDKAFQTAIKEQDNIVIDLFLTSGYDASFVLKDAIEIYTQPANQNIHLIKKLIDHSINLKVKHQWAFDYITALGAAVNSENLAIIELLLDKGVDPDDNQGEALRNALFKQRNFKIANLLIQRGANINIEYENQSLLYHSIIKDSLDKSLYGQDNQEATNYLIKKGININDGKDGNSDSLIMAIQENNLELVETLLKYGANINSTVQNSCQLLTSSGQTNQQYSIREIAQNQPAMLAILNRYT
ncbi:hypothetical protein NIES4102_32110 [Chondrocystis sp. NIES-4102]|nr:hypothetical protein NIES4102_32110 [Chondrocystis sp. NIES-4102]